MRVLNTFQMNAEAACGRNDAGPEGRSWRRGSGTLAVFALVALGLSGWTPVDLQAQAVNGGLKSAVELPDAPGIVAGLMPPSEVLPSEAPGGQSATAMLSGTVLDTNGDVIQGARVTLRGQGGAEVRAVQSGVNGEFAFTGLPAGTYTLTASATGMGTVTLVGIMLHAGEFRLVDHVALPLEAAATSVTVVGDPEELAQEQVHIAVEQRVLGIVPNFYSTYDWNAPPMGSKQKFHLAFRAVSDPVAFVGAGAVAGFEQASNTFPGYGQGALGFAKRFGAEYANDFDSRILGSAVFPSIFRQDPRYFYKGSGSIVSRALYAIGCSVIARGDNGRWGPNYSHVLGSFAAGGLANLYYPAANRGVSLTLTTGLIETAGHAGNNLLREFVLKGITTHGPNFGKGKQ